MAKGVAISIRIRGVRQAQARLKRVHETVADIFTKGPDRAAFITRQALLEHVPVWTGHLKESIIEVPVRPGQARVQSFEFSSPPPVRPGSASYRKTAKAYARYPQEGWAKPESTGYIDRAVEQAFQKIEEANTRAIRRAVR
jgi:hypothetical protein